MDNNILTQIGFIVLIGLASKNAILGVEAAKLRIRPILMTSIAFILGVMPLAFATGAGAEMRQVLGTAVFTGMIGVTVAGLFLTPVFYVIIRKIILRNKKSSPPM